MTGLHRIGRRRFLTDLGRGTLAVVVFGVGAGACSSSSENGPDDGDGGTATETTEAAETGSSAETTSTTSSTTDAAENTAATTETGSGPLRYERVSFGFVSAYVLFRGSEAAVVDTGTPGAGSMIGEVLDSAGSSWDQVGHVILTHHHGDHVGGLRDVMGLASGATAYAGTEDVDAIDAPVELRPVVDGDEVFGLRIVATPGHTPGHISVLDPAGSLLVAGDALNGTDGTGVTGPNADFSDDMTRALESARKLGTLEYAAMLPGHGEPLADAASDAVRDLADSL